MIYKSHLVELWVNGKKVELESQDSVNVRFNNTLLDPTKISSTQAEYSFEFSIPCTPHNNKIFDYANNLSKLNKFHTRWNAELYGDGTIIFKGTLTINSIKDNKYNVNLVSVKVKSLEEIFGEMTMNQIKDWKIDFNGVETINAINSMLETDVVFPLVSYGVFQKSPYNSDDVANDFTSKFDLDKWNNWYVESFYPSHKMLTTLRKAFENKGYTVGGDAFQDQFLNSIYMSVNLADGQDPQYNLGNPRFGSIDLTVNFSRSGKTPYEQELKYPYYKVSGIVAANRGISVETEYNLTSIDIYDLMSDGTVTVNAPSPSYMYQPNEHLVVIPQSGFYKIALSATTTLNSTGTFTASQFIYDSLDREIREEDITMSVGLDEHTPVEIQLIRNYDDNIELIKGKRNKSYVNGNCTDTSQGNVNEWLTCFPHEDPYNSTLPTEKNDLTLINTNSMFGGRRGVSNENGNFGGQRTRGGTIDRNGGGRNWSRLDLGYVYNNGETMMYDQAVTDIFICGLSSFYEGVASTMKNGYSWSKSTAIKNDAFYVQNGYAFLSGTPIDTASWTTDHNKNVYYNAPTSYVNISNNTMRGYVVCMVWLEKGDRLQLAEVHRGYDSSTRYNTTTNVNLKISAASPRSYWQLKESVYGYNSQTEFDTQLNLANFFNQEKKVSEWVQNIADAFNLEINQYGNSVNIDVKKKLGLGNAAVDLDNRANTYNAESAMITYPRSMAVKYKIDTDEWGFERSAVAAAGGDESILNDDDWYKYGDSGFSEIILNDDSYETSKSEKNLPFSYSWYDNFNWYQVDSGGTQPTGQTPSRLSLPVISKYSYMIDGYDYDESMKHDGYGLSQRFWFKPRNSGCYVWTRTYPTEQVFLYEPSNLLTNYQDLYFNLSYKVTERSLLTEYFSINAYLASNYVNIDVYLSADEYNMLKNGAMAHFDSDLYYVCSIEGYDPSGYNPTTLKLMKKVN
jgi:hypothetical protein